MFHKPSQDDLLLVWVSGISGEKRLEVALGRRFGKHRSRKATRTKMAQLFGVGGHDGLLVGLQE